MADNTNRSAPRILVVDDDQPPVCDTLKPLLEGPPLYAQVDVFPDGNSAIDHILEYFDAQETWDLVILDMLMPDAANEGMDEEAGLKMLVAWLEPQRRFQLRFQKIPTIVFTNHPSYSNCVACMQAGATDYIPKLDTTTGQNGVKRLHQRCIELLQPQTPSLSSCLEKWMDSHIEWLAEKCGGKVVAMVKEEEVEAVGWEGEIKDGFALVFEDNYELLHLKILKDKQLRWVTPHFFPVPTSQELYPAISSDEVR